MSITAIAPIGENIDDCKTPMQTFIASQHLALEKILELQFDQEEKEETKTTTRQLFVVSYSTTHLSV